MRISVIVPTYQRRDLVVACVMALGRQEFANFEIIVVVDGSTDGTAEALAALRMPCPLRVLEQTNRGTAAARKLGGFAARGEILLFLDDDMEADPRLLAEHDRSHTEGASVVLGHFPLHPDSPRGLLSRWVAQWVVNRAARLSANGSTIPASEFGGQLSVSREAFIAVGGFDERLKRGVDSDFGHRLRRHGYSAVFNPSAISFQRYTVRPREFLRQWREAGRTAVICARKQPEEASRFLRKPWNRRRFRLLAQTPLLTAPLRWLAVELVERGYEGRVTEKLFSCARALEFCQGMREAGGVPKPRTLRVLAYHAITDTAGAGRFEPYGVSPEDFRWQIEYLKRAGFHFVSAEEVVHYLRGSGGLPRRPVLLTFDDCFVSVVEHALPVLEAEGLPAAAFAVSARVGAASDWSRAPDAPQLPLLDVDGLLRLSRAGVEIGTHSRTHPQLPRLGSEALEAEVVGSREQLQQMGLGQVRLFAYPFGETDDRVRHAVQRAGCEIAFTVEPGFVRPGADRFSVPRIEILRGDVGWRFRWKVAVAGPLLREGASFTEALWQRWGETMVLRIARALRSRRLTRLLPSQVLFR